MGEGNGINWEGVFCNLPEIMGMEMKRKGSRWYSYNRMDGSRTQRWDKLSCRLVDRGVQIMEQGATGITLWNWLLTYGGCATNSEVFNVLKGYQRASSHTGWIREEEKPRRHVDMSRVYESVRFRQTHGSSFSLWLEGLFGKKRVNDILDMYMVGAEPEGLCVFWNINSQFKTCHDKGMIYRDDGRRDKSTQILRYWKKKDGYSDHCFFGEHLLGENTDERIFVVESEKTAVLSRLFFGRGCWLATGGKNAITGLKMPKNATLLPDVDSYDFWCEKFPSSSVVKWWEKYSEYPCGEKDDIGDYVIWRLSDGGMS